MTLFEQTRKLLKERPAAMTLQDIAENTGISYHWLSDLNKGRNKTYCVNYVQKLYEFLAKDPARLNF